MAFSGWMPTGCKQMSFSRNSVFFPLSWNFNCYYVNQIEFCTNLSSCVKIPWISPVALMPPGFYRLFPVDKPVDNVDNCPVPFLIFWGIFSVYVNRCSVTRSPLGIEYSVWIILNKRWRKHAPALRSLIRCIRRTGVYSRRKAILFNCF